MSLKTTLRGLFWSVISKLFCSKFKSRIRLDGTKRGVTWDYLLENYHQVYKDVCINIKEIYKK